MTKYIDSDSKEIEKYCLKKKYLFKKRLPKLAHDNANGNNLLNYHANMIDADYYFQLFVTAPLLKVKSINKCIKILKGNKKIDSIFTIKKIFSWFWYKDKPVNYNPKILPRSQDAIPLIQESTGLYGISRKALKKYKCRIGKKPYFFEITQKEALDLDTKEDLEILKFYAK